jgi:multiple sugar transport system permease protein
VRHGAALQREVQVDQPPRKGYAKIFERAEWLGPLMLAPAIVYILALIAFPFGLALLYSVSYVTTGSQTIAFAGLDNFRSILDSPTFLKALKNTFIFTLTSQILVMVLAQIMALALQQTFSGKPIVRFLLLLPWVSPIALGSIGWKWMYDSLYSVINWTLQALHIIGPNTWPYWLGEPDLAMMAVIMVHVWRMFPFATVILLAGLTSLPQEVLEAAAVDGAGFWRRLFQIILPMLRPIMTVAVLFGVVFTFADMTVIYVLTRGGPYDSTHVLGSLAFFVGIIGGDLGEGAAISIFLFPLLFIVAIVMLRIARRTEVD